MNETGDYERIEKAIRYLDLHRASQPGLEEVAKHVHLSPFHFERMFLRWAGVSPKKYLQYLTKEHAKVLLKESASVLDAAHESGLSGPGRLHDLLVTYEGMTPGEWKKRGEGLVIEHGVHDSPFGLCLIGQTSKGVCCLQFIANEDEADGVLGAAWPKAVLRRDLASTGRTLRRIFCAPGEGKDAKLRLFLAGTKFQLAVWQALLEIPEGSLSTYQSIARSLGQAGASRAVGRAVGSNPIAYLIPCHRVLRGSGELGGYRWGLERKTAMLFREYAAREKALVSKR